MKKYMLSIIEKMETKNYNITTKSNDENLVSFPAEIGNPNYDQFLTQTGLTDAQVRELSVGEWIEA